MSSLIAEGLNTAMVGLIMVFACLLLLMLVIVGIGKLSSLTDRAGQDSHSTDEDYNGFDNVKEEVAVLCAVLAVWMWQTRRRYPCLTEKAESENDVSSSG